ncbi:hypothetical protein [Paenibacillus sp. ISL-20]|uniref:hypothetical protein n=1 Tax=Paenibacillus sp. ISL-20 TaxID=2819163 RepID=UPI001BED063A|nr:hypothetical protein [Paenibacillus sp. ISL-20]MBT2764032.1 hypothetical protein [Paenibacillus sp. ISL-20]
MHSLYINNLHKKLSNLNNNLCFHLFVIEQFNIDSYERMQAKPENYLKEIYESNKFADALNIISKNFAQENESYTNELYKNFYITLYSHFDYYIEELFDFLSIVIGSQSEIKTSGNKTEQKSRVHKMIEQIIGEEQSDLKEHIETELLQTYDYIRLRRNKVIHNMENTTKELKTIARYHGKSLNEYWIKILNRKKQSDEDMVQDNEDIKVTQLNANRRHKFELSYQFSADEASLDQFSLNEILSFLNILRKFSEIFDEKFMELIYKFHKDKMILFSLDLFVRGQKNTDYYPIKTFERKFKSFTYINFGIIIHREETSEFYDNYISKLRA